MRYFSHCKYNVYDCSFLQQIEAFRLEGINSIMSMADFALTSEIAKTCLKLDSCLQQEGKTSLALNTVHQRTHAVPLFFDSLAIRYWLSMLVGLSRKLD